MAPITKDGTKPLLACFGDGQPPQNRISKTSQGCLQFKYLQKAVLQGERKTLRTKRMVLAQASDGTAYVGSNFSGGIATQSTTSGVQYLIGCFNPASSALELVECISPVFTLTRHLEKQETIVENEDGPISQNTLLRTDGKSKYQAKKELIETFGSRKAKRAKRSRERGRITTDSISTGTKELLEKRSQALIDKAAAGGDTADPTATAFMAARRRMLPPFDLEATKVEDVYDFAAIISEEDAKILLPRVKELEGLLRKLSSAMLVERQKKKPLPTFIHRHLLRLHQIEPKLRKKNLVRVAYMHALIQMTALPRRVKSLADGASPPQLPEKLLERGLGTFALPEGNNTWNRTSFHVDKLLIYACVVALALENFTVDPSLLAGDLHAPVAKLKELFKELGCLPVRRKAEEDKKARQVMMLNVPLKFPIRRKRKQGR